MTSIFTYLPFLISVLIGYFLISAIKGKTSLAPSLQLFLGAGLGMGISGQMTFKSFILFDQLNKPFVIISHCLTLAALIIIYLVQHRPWEKKISWKWDIALIKSFLPFGVIILFSIPLWVHAHFYAYGGWDAWSTWNLKAKFLYSGGHNWRNLFDSLLWRSSPHYPLLQPLMNVWGWAMTDSSNLSVPVFTSFLFSFSTVNLLFLSIRTFTKNNWAVLAPTALLTLPYFMKLSYSQYCDIIVSFYLLAGLFCLIMAEKEKSILWAVLSGIFIGFLSFTKSEGLAAAAIIGFLGVGSLLWVNRCDKKILLTIIAAAGLATVPTAIYNLIYAPANETIIFGLNSADHPVSLYRLKVIFAFYLVELSSSNWNGLWFIILACLVLSAGRCFNRQILIIPLFFLLYGVVLTFYYWTNTYFKIEWWLQVSYHRIIYALLPTALLWAFIALARANDKIDPVKGVRS